MGISGARQATIYKASDSTDFITLKLIAPQSHYAKQDITSEDLDGNLVVEEEEAVLRLSFYDEADMVKLEGWKAAGTTLNIDVIGIEDSIFWNHNSKFSLEEPGQFSPRRRNIRIITFTAAGKDLDIERLTVFILVDENQKVLTGFIGTREDAEGILATSVDPASFGLTGSVTWTIDGTIHDMETVEFNTLN